MSDVTDIIFITALNDGGEATKGNPNTDKLNKYIKQEHNGCGLIKVNAFAGGSKVMQCDVFMAALKYMDVDAFVQCFNDIKWEHPESVQLLIKEESDVNFTVFLPKT